MFHLMTVFSTIWIGLTLAVADLSQSGVAAGSEAAENGAPMWLQVVMTVIGLAVTAFLLPWLKQKASEARANAAAAFADANNNKLNARQKLRMIVLDYVMGLAANTAEKRFPALAKAIKTHGLSSDQIKKQLHAWGDDVKKRTVEYFKAQGIDVLAEIGDDGLDELIEWAANKTSPFPGKETTAALLKDGVTDMLIDYGVDYVRNKWLLDAPEPNKPADE